MIDLTIKEDFPKSEIEFDQRFSNIDACYDYLAQNRWPNGFMASSDLVMGIRSRRSKRPVSARQVECVEKQSVEFAAASPLHQSWSEPCGLPSSASRVAGENGPSVRRAFGHAASPRRRTRHPGLPASRARRSPAAPPDCAAVSFAGQNDPAAPSVFRVRSRRLPARVGQTYRQNTHT